MTILDEILADLDGRTPVRDVCVGALLTAVVVGEDTPQCGLATTVMSVHNHEHTPVAQAGELIGQQARELARWVTSASLLERSIGMATINALLQADESRCTELNARDLLIEHGAKKVVALVGHFSFVEKLRDRVGQLWVLEQHPQEGDLPAERARDVLPQADIVAITAQTLINGTLDELLRLCRRDALVILIGPSSPLSPALFAHNISAISGARVVDIDLALRYVSQGATFKQMKGVRLLTMTHFDNK